MVFAWFKNVICLFGTGSGEGNSNVGGKRSLQPDSDVTSGDIVVQSQRAEIQWALNSVMDISARKPYMFEWKHACFIVFYDKKFSWSLSSL